MAIMRSCIIALACAFAALAAPSRAEDLAFIVINETYEALIGFYVSPSDTDIWEYNLLSYDYLEIGDDAWVSIRDGLDICHYDIRGVFADGEVVEDYELDLCDLGSYTFVE